jgi:hypothetical protein
VRALALVVALGALAGCGADADCRDLCATLMLDCGMGTWTDSAQCTQGCDEELFRHPARDEVVECYTSAAESCDLIAVLQCRQDADVLAAGALDSED